MSGIETLIEMGFTREKAEHALKISGGVEQAMEWLLAHVDDELPNNASTITKVENESTSTAPALEPTEAEADTEAEAEAKSFKCDECNKLFRDQVEVEFHAAKTGHSKFSESTEEKKPLTEDEKKAQLVLIEEKLKQKRIEREKQDRIDSLEREKLRIKSGKDMTEAKKRMEEMEMAKILEQRKREKAEEKAVRERVKAMIESDKLARKAKMAAEQGIPMPVEVKSTPIVSSPSSAGVKKDYTETKIQVRLQDGSTLAETFNVKEPLSSIRTFIQMKQGPEVSFDLMTTFPRKVFVEEDYEKPLDILGLVPSAVVIVTKRK